MKKAAVPSILVVAVLLAVANIAEAQQPKKVPRIGVLSPSSSGFSPLLDAFRQGLRELGYIEGQNIAIEYRFAEANPEALPDLAAELVHLKVDLILTITTPPTQPAHNATKTSSFILTGIALPLEPDTRRPRPGGNVTGPISLATEKMKRRLQQIRERPHKIRRVPAHLKPANPGVPRVKGPLPFPPGRAGL